MLASTPRILAILTACLVAACGEMRWTKPGGSDANLTADLANCRAAAHSSVERAYGPRLPQTSQGRLGNAPVEPSPADRQMREQEAVNRCMQEQGYQLVPVDQ